MQNPIVQDIAVMLTQFMGEAQICALTQACNGEEGRDFAKVLVNLSTKLSLMPRTYEQDGLGDQSVAHLHYFMGGMDWYITERDMEEEQLQAFGLADLGMGYAELGYISIQEITANGAELDLHWTPQTIAAIQESKEA